MFERFKLRSLFGRVTVLSYILIASNIGNVAMPFNFGVDDLVVSASVVSVVPFKPESPELVQLW